MSIKLLTHTGEIPLSISKFPAGESNVRFDVESLAEAFEEGLTNCLTIVVNFESNDDIINLLLLTDAIRRELFLHEHVIRLHLPYLPYARQDRVCNDGEPLSISVIANLINSQQYDSVTCLDIHSSVGAALINNLRHIEMSMAIREIQNFISIPRCVIVSPDLGAIKKASSVFESMNFSDFMTANKIRNPKNGQIEGIEVINPFHIGSRDFLIADDICDGGKTFTELAKKLRPLTDGKIYLYVTHGIFTKGMAVFDGLIDGIYTANLMGSNHELITEI